jgi:AraC-like DNA-binding protein
VTFNSTQPGINISRHAACQTENALLPPAFRALRNQQTEAFSSATGVNAPLMQQLQPLLLKRLPRGQVSLTGIADDLNMSPRTLQRRLGEHGLSYQSLLDAVREQLACRYLQQNNLTYLELAYLLGFSEQSAFNRAFRKWTGTPPGQYRALSVHHKLR